MVYFDKVGPQLADKPEGKIHAQALTHTYTHTHTQHKFNELEFATKATKMQLHIVDGDLLPHV